MDGMLTLYPTPVVMVSCQRPGERPNIIILAWAGVVCSQPEMVSIAFMIPNYYPVKLTPIGSYGYSKKVEQ